MPDCQQKKREAKECTRGERKTAESASLGSLWHFVHPWGEFKIIQYNRPNGLHCLANVCIHSTLFPFPPVKMSWYLIIVTFRSPWAMAKKWSGLHQTKSCCSLCSLALIHHSTRHGQSLILHESGDLPRARVVIVQRLKCW